MSTTYSFWPNREYFLELLRPWKLTTLGVGMAWLIYGALYYGISDWDVGISLIMGGLTYLCAPWSVTVLLDAPRFRPRGWPIHMIGALIVALFVVDCVYWIYHTAMGNQMFRLRNFYASSTLYFLAGAIWAYRGSLRNLFADLRTLKRSRSE
jgi:hypothetical protein